MLLAERASRRNRGTTVGSSSMLWCSVLIATRRPVFWLRASNTWPMPPAPSTRRMRYFPPIVSPTTRIAGPLREIPRRSKAFAQRRRVAAAVELPFAAMCVATPDPAARVARGDVEVRPRALEKHARAAAAPVSDAGMMGPQSDHDGPRVRLGVTSPPAVARA